MNASDRIIQSKRKREWEKIHGVGAFNLLVLASVLRKRNQNYKLEFSAQVFVQHVANDVTLKNSTCRISKLIFLINIADRISTHRSLQTQDPMCSLLRLLSLLPGPLQPLGGVSPSRGANTPELQSTYASLFTCQPH